MLRKLVLLFLLLIGFTISKAQVKGIVTNANQQPLANATVYLKQKDGLVIAFAKTNETGNFLFNKKYNLTNNDFICASYIGYKDSCLNAVNTTDSFIIITLNKTATVLKEVVVNNRVSPITVKGDTTKYNIAKFTNGTEDKLEDILKKLPGIDVDATGGLTFKGKKIDKVLIEGEDFFSKDYKVLTKTITAAAISEVEAIENYEEEELLSDAKKGNETVLNIGLKEAFKLKVFGEFTVGAGTNKDWQLANNLFSLNAKTKIGLINNYNNYAVDIKPNVQEQLQLNDVLPKNIFSNSNRNLPINTLAPITATYEINRDTWASPKVSTLQLNKKVGSKLFIKSNSSYKFNELQQFQTIGTSFINSNINILDSGMQAANTYLFSTKNDIEYKLTTTSKLKASVSFNSNDISTNNDILTKFQNMGFNSNYQQTNTNNNFIGKLSYIKKLTANTTFEINYYLANNKNQENIFSNTIRLNNVLGLGNTDGIVENKVALSDNHYIAQAVLYKQFKNNKLSISTNFVNTSSSLISNFFVFDKAVFQNKMLDSLAFKNDLITHTNIYWTEIKNQYKKGKLFLEVAANYTNYTNRLTNQLVGTNFQKYQSNKILPSIMVATIIGKYAKLGLLYNQYFLFQDITSFSSGFVQNNINSFTKNESFLPTNITNDYILSYNYNNFLNKGIMFNGSLIYSKNNTPSFIKNSIVAANILNEMSISNKPREDVYLILGGDKFISALKSTLKLNSTFGTSKTFDNASVTNFDYNRIYTINISAGLKSGFKGVFNFYSNITINTNQLNTVLKDGTTTTSFSANNWSTKQSLLIRGSDQLFGYIAYDYNAFNNTSVKSSANFGEFKLSYKPKKSAFSYSVFGRNIFNNTELFSNAITPQISTNSSRVLLPRTLIFSITRKF